AISAFARHELRMKRKNMRPTRTRWSKTFQHPANGNTFSIPRGLCRSAQGCEERATLGMQTENISTPTGLWQTNRDGYNSIGVREFFRNGPRVARSSQPWAEYWNPFGIRRIAPLHRFRALLVAVALLAVSKLGAQVVADGATNTLSNVTT